MKRFIKNGLRVIADYGIALLIFVVFLYAVLSWGNANLTMWLIIYSAVVCFIFLLLLSMDMKMLAVKEKKPQNKINPKPYDGFLYGIIGVLPLAVIETVSLLLVFQDSVAERINHYALQTIMGPVYFIVKALSSSYWGYIAATLFIAVMSGIWYMMGYYDIYILRLLGLRRKPAEMQEQQKKGFPYFVHPWYKK